MGKMPTFARDMNILFVINNFYGHGNGLNSSARNAVGNLRSSGQNVRILTMRSENPNDPLPDYPLRKFNFPIFQKLIEKQSYCFAVSDATMIRKALEWADVVHIEETFVLQWRTVRMARKMGVPCVSTYHIHPENITFSLGMGWCRPLNVLVLKMFQKLVFDRCSDIQCPTLNVMERLKRYRFKSELHVISNGIRIPEERIVAGRPDTDPLFILSIGRLSNEKDQTTLMKAMRYCRNAGRIQLYLAGQGPKEKRVRRQADRLYADGVVKYPVQTGFHSPDELREMSRRAYLNIHMAVIEVEGLSCIEAIREGSVPVIAKGPLTATSQFALDERSIFPIRDAKALAERIDWWIEHPEERLAMGQKYADSARSYDVDLSTAALIGMYENAIRKAGRD